MTPSTRPPPSTVSARSLSALLTLGLLAACNAFNHPPPRDPPPTTSDASPAPPNPLPHAADALHAAIERGTDEAQRLPPGAPPAWRVRDTAHRLTARALLPALIEAASRRVHLATNAASLRTAWPTSPPRRLPAYPGRRAIPPGTIDLIYPKGRAHLRLELFDAEGLMRPEAYTAICRALYEPSRTPTIEEAWIALDPRLLTVLYTIGQHFDAPIEIVSAFRTERGRKRSNHNTGHAADIVIKDKSRAALMAWVESTFERVGVGWYPRSTFIHVDTRERSWYWTDPSRPGRAGRAIERKIIRKPRTGADPTVRTIHIPPPTTLPPPGPARRRRG